MRALFDGDEFEHWRKGNHLLHLFLDSLDEYAFRALLNVQTLRHVLAQRDLTNALEGSILRPQ
jgi:hypothetical protein